MVLDLAGFLRGIRPTVDNYVDDLAQQETVVSVGLFGSWTRYEASATSNVDILVVDRSDLGFEFNELIEYKGLIMDVNRIPWKWVGEVITPEIDHRLQETQILHDPSGLLTRAKNFVGNCYRTRGRVEVRTEGYLTNADMYLSRSSSAMTRNDLETAFLFADLSLAPIAHVLMDVAGLPVNRSAHIWNLRRSCEKLDLLEIYRTVVTVARLSRLEKEDVSNSLDLFRSVWQEISDYMVDNQDEVDSLHDRLKKEISYMMNPALLKSILRKTGEMLNSNNFVEAAMCMRSRLLPFLENYAWLVLAKRGDKFDYTSLFKTIKEYGGSIEIYDGATEIFNLKNVEWNMVKQAADTARSVIVQVRTARRDLINRFVV